jgi:ferredoxin
MSKFIVNKRRCIGCGTCIQSCEGATELGDDMKAVVIDNEKLEECGGAKVCPFGAIEEIKENKKDA